MFLKDKKFIEFILKNYGNEYDPVDNDFRMAIFHLDKVQLQEENNRKDVEIFLKLINISGYWNGGLRTYFETQNNNADNFLSFEDTYTFLNENLSQVYNLPIAFQIEYLNLLNEIYIIKNHGKKSGKEGLGKEYKDFKENILEKYNVFWSELMVGNAPNLKKFWIILDYFLEDVVKNKIDYNSTKNLIFELYKTPFESVNLFSLIISEFLIKKYKWIETIELELVYSKICNLASKLYLEDQSFSRLLDLISNVPSKPEFLNWHRDLMEIILNRLEGYFKRDDFNWALASQIISKSKLLLNKNNNYSKQDLHEFNKKIVSLEEENSKIARSTMQPISVDMTKTVVAFREYFEKIKSSPLFVRITIASRYFISINYYSNIESEHNSFTNLFTKLNLDNKGTSYVGNNFYNENLFTNNSFTLDLIFEFIIQKLNPDEFDELISSRLENILKFKDFGERYINLPEVSKMLFEEFNTLKDSFLEAGNLNKNEIDKLIFRNSVFAESLMSKIEILIRILFSVSTKNSFFNIQDNKTKFVGTDNMLNEIEKNAKDFSDNYVGDLEIKGFIQFINAYLFNSNDGYRNILAHGYDLKYFSAGSFKLTYRFWSVFVILLSLINCFEVQD